MARAALRATQNDPLPYVRFEGLRVAIAIRAHPFRQGLLDALRDPDAWVRERAAAWLSRFSRGRYRTVVRDALLTVASDPDEEAEVRAVALNSLIQYPGSAINRLLDGLAGGPAGRLRDMALEALERRQGLGLRGPRRAHQDEGSP